MHSFEALQLANVVHASQGSEGNAAKLHMLYTQEHTLCTTGWPSNCRPMLCVQADLQESFE